MPDTGAFARNLPIFSRVRRSRQKFRTKRLLKDLEHRIFSGGEFVTEAEACRLIRTDDAHLPLLLALADRVRDRYKGKEVRLCSIVNAKSGRCPENCGFCSQSAHFKDADAPVYPLLPASEIAKAAREAAAMEAREFSIVTSGTGPKSVKEIQNVVDALTLIREETKLKRCASLGITDETVLRELKAAGLQNYHHNLETARSFFPNICTTHTYEDDRKTVLTAKRLGFYTCCGGIFGMGETPEQRVELAMDLRELDVDSIPINFLNPRPGTPLEKAHFLTPGDCLRVVAVYRLVMPKKDIFVAGGREINLKDEQSKIFGAGANGMMIGNYLTTKGRGAEADHQMIQDVGMTVLH